MVCGVEGQLQHLSKNYYRVKHYLGRDPVTRKLRFNYHRQSPEYVQSLLSHTRMIDPIDQKNIDLNKPNSSSFECEGWDSNPRRPSPEDLKSSPLS